jgi:tetratricopeptide (TPR) repeat protein
MNKLEPPDSHYLRAAEGWLELGVPAEAAAEMRQVAPRFQEYPAVLRLRWEIHSGLKDWPEALSVSRKQIELSPQDPDGYIKHANTLYFMGCTAQARDMVLPLLEKFPKNPSFLYNLACYECQLGNLDKAMEWLGQAFDQGTHLRAMAMVDPDLEPLRAQNRL